MSEINETLPCGHTVDRIENDEVTADEHERLCGETVKAHLSVTAPPVQTYPRSLMVLCGETLLEVRTEGAWGSGSWKVCTPGGTRIDSGVGYSYEDAVADARRRATEGEVHRLMRKALDTYLGSVRAVDGATED